MSSLPPIPSDLDINQDVSGIAALEEGDPELGKHFLQHWHSTTTLFTKRLRHRLGQGCPFSAIGYAKPS